MAEGQGDYYDLCWRRTQCELEIQQIEREIEERKGRVLTLSRTWSELDRQVKETLSARLKAIRERNRSSEGG